ncbi:nucleolar RNA-binding protein NIFK [Moesziomyces antarcticus T-34]|uniref:Nucleolar RNA-binding protein NIFK n=1 Tax=Pseudozyma antarctica (strain T-34) TaxID=1151754 RepID=M9MG29_PSEA3|nr:nucleolar RNA-binding protein NIFK [Moesziomyces antarcticus T-34]
MPPKKTSTAATGAKKPAPAKPTKAAKAAPAKAAPAKAAPAKAAPAKVEPVAAAPSAKANGKKRAAATDAVTATATTTKKAKTPKAAAPAPAPAPESEDSDAGAQNEREILASLSDLPNSKDDAVVKARLDKLRRSKTNASTTPGVLYIGRLPKGFFEKQIKAYFTQFGDVTRVRVSRNKKTGASKHYAFVEFGDRDVAQIVEETMHNYLIDGRLLQVKSVPKDKVHPELWVGANRKFKRVPTDRIERVVRSRDKTDEQHKRTHERVLARQEQRRTKLKDMGIDYDFPGYTDDKPQAKRKSKATA